MFLDRYFRTRNRQGDAQCGILDDIVNRAECAREIYKLKRLRIEEVDSKDRDLTPREKYSRRFNLNRCSAAACRVYREVLRRENYTL